MFIFAIAIVAVIYSSEDEADKTGVNDSNRSTESEIVAELKMIPVAEYEKNFRLYSDLLKIDPNNQRYQKKVLFYSQKIKNKETKKEADDKARVENRRRNEIPRRAEVIRLVKAQNAVFDASWGQRISLWIWMGNEGKNYSSVADFFCRTVVRPRKLGTIYIHIYRRGTMDQMGESKCRQ